jgi:hypothetical protein
VVGSGRRGRIKQKCEEAEALSKTEAVGRKIGSVLL